MTNKQIITEQGSYYLVDLSELDMFNAGYQYDHCTEDDTRYFIMKKKDKMYVIDSAFDQVKIIKSILKEHRILEKLQLSKDNLEDNIIEEILEYLYLRKVSMGCPITLRESITNVLHGQFSLKTNIISEQKFSYIPLEKQFFETWSKQY